MFLWKFCFGFQNSIKILDPLCSFPFKDERITDFGLSMSIVLNKKDLFLVEDSGYGFKFGLL